MNRKMYSLGVGRSVIREIFEYAKVRKAEIGEGNVFDFSIGNPSVPAPELVRDTLSDILKNTDPVLLHGYTSAQGDASVRAAISDFIEKDYIKDLQQIKETIRANQNKAMVVVNNELIKTYYEIGKILGGLIKYYAKIKI